MEAIQTFSLYLSACSYVCVPLLKAGQSDWGLKVRHTTQAMTVHGISQEYEEGKRERQRDRDRERRKQVCLSEVLQGMKGGSEHENKTNYR